MASISSTSRQDVAAERRAEILAAAGRCLSEIGYDRVRLRDVSRESGVSIGLIQHYFETRDLLLREAFELASDEMMARAEAAAADRDPWQRIVDLIETLPEDDDLHRRSVIWTEFCVVASREPVMREGVHRIYKAWRRHIAKAVRDGVQSGLFKPVLAIDDVIDALVAQVDGCELEAAAVYDRIDSKRFRQLVLRTASALLGRDGH